MKEAEEEGREGGREGGRERQTGILLKPAAVICARVFSFKGAEEDRQVTCCQGTMTSATVLEEI